MPLAERQEAIRRLEAIRGTRVVVYVTGDRPTGGPGLTLPLSIEPNVVPVVYDALRKVGRVEHIDLFLYTRGGSVDTVWPIVSLLREFATRRLSVLVPFRAHSAGTLLALGADEIVMCEAAELTSIDPTTGNAFNPVDELDKGKRKGISVEDVTAYFDFVRENKKVGLTDPAHVLAVLQELTRQLHPLALGHVQRVHMQIRQLAERLLRAGRDKVDEKWVKEVIATLTEKLYSHTHAVNRRDAQKLLGDRVVVPDDAEHDAIRSLFDLYSEALSLKDAHNLLRDLGGLQQKDLTYARGAIEIANYSALYQSDVTVTAMSQQVPNWILTQNAQTALNNLNVGNAALPVYLKGLPSVFNTDVTFEGWRENQTGV